MFIKPLLAFTVDNTATLQYPLLASVKLDGIRCLVIDGVVLSRSLKPIRNVHVQKLFGRPEFEGLDGELIVGPPNAHDVYRVTNSGVMSEDGEPDVHFYIFDSVLNTDDPYNVRYRKIPTNLPNSTRLEQHVITCEQVLLDFEQGILDQGYEGVMIRSIEGRYKGGRSTARDGILGKLKRFIDEEFEIVDFQERMHNANEATINALGRTERSSHKENMIGRGDLGALVLKVGDTTFTCGSGFNDAQRVEIFNNKEKYRGAFAKIKHFAIGAKDLPRFPVFLDIRHKDDQ